MLKTISIALLVAGFLFYLFSQNCLYFLSFSLLLMNLGAVLLSISLTRKKKAE